MTSNNNASREAPSQADMINFEKSTYASQIKNALYALLGRSKPIAPEDIQTKLSDTPDSTTTASNSDNDSEKHDSPKPS